MGSPNERGARMVGASREEGSPALAAAMAVASKLDEAYGDSVVGPPAADGSRRVVGADHADGDARATFVVDGQGGIRAVDDLDGLLDEVREAVSR